jgi:hypothetical protein
MRDRWRLLGRLLLASAILAVLCDQAAIAGAAAHKKEEGSSSVLLRNSYLIGRDFVPAQRAFLLFHLATAAENISPDLSKQWAKDLFRVTFELDPDWNRSALQKNAVAVLATTDPVQAFRLLATMSPLPNQPILPEDLRADAAKTVFLDYWNNKKTKNRLQAIRVRASAIAADGQYPFSAVSPMLRYLLERDESAGLAWFSEICLAYQQGNPNIRAANPEFVAFVQDFWPTMPTSTRREVLSVLIPKLSEKDTFASSGAYLTRVKTSFGSFDFSSLNEELLFRVLPLVREADPEWAERLIKEHSASFPQTGPQDRVVEEAQVYVGGSGTSGQSRDPGAILQQQAQLGTVFDSLDQDPEKAVQLAGQIIDSHAHLSALEGITANLGEKDLKENAVTVEGQAKSILEAATTSLDKVRALVLLAQMSANLGDTDAFHNYMDRGFDMGELVFEEFVQLHPVADIEGAEVFNPLMTLVATGMRFRTADTIARIQQCGDHLLTAYLLIGAAARGSSDRATSH